MRILAIAIVFGVSFFASGCITINTNGGNSAQGSPTPQPTVRHEKSSTSATINGRTVSIEMSDEAIFAAFDLKVTKDDINVSKGPDGYSASYKKNEQFVSITRSVVTGTVIYATGPIAGEWHLGGGLQ